MRASSFLTLISVMAVLPLSVVPALAQGALPNVTGRDWVWIIALVALIAAFLWYFMRADKRA